MQDGLAACRSLAVGSLQGRVVVKPEIRGLEEDELDGQSLWADVRLWHGRRACLVLSLGRKTRTGTLNH